jgi:uncharacterized membrane protein
MASNQDILKELRKQGKRISKLEKELEVRDDEDHEEEEVEEEERAVKGGRKRDSISFPKLSFNQIITFIGIVGVIIGAISFFFYAVANNWIGETGQIMIGVILGFILFGFAFMLRKDKEQWSNIVFGGAYFIEYLAIGIGVLEYEVLPNFIGIALALVFLVSSTLLSIKFKARIIAYFTLVGGFLIPFITGTFENDLFVTVFYVLLSIGLVVLSFYENWYDLRFVSYAVVGIFILSSFDKFVNASNKIVPVLFLVSIFVLYKLAVLINSFNNKKDDISVLDSIIVVSITVMFLWFIYNMFDFSEEMYGIFVMVFSFLYLVEIFYFKIQNVKTRHSIIYTLLSTGIVCLNLGFLLLISSVDMDFFLILFAVEYVLFSVLSVKTDEKVVYQMFSFISLGLIVIWYVSVLGFKEGIGHASFFLFVLFCMVLSFFFLFKKDINFKLNAAAFIIGGFAFIFSFYKYLWYWGIRDEYAHIVLSILWLIYTLVLFHNVETREGKWLVGGLLGVTLVKIAFNDLFYLEGISRIVGFIIFGILLIIGGYFIKNESDKK